MKKESFIKIESGFYDLGNTGHAVRKAKKGPTKGLWYHIDFADNLSGPFNTAKEAKENALLAAYGYGDWNGGSFPGKEKKFNVFCRAALC